jgi:hypothetical protein
MSTHIRALGVVVALLAVACGDDDGESKEATGSPEETASACEAASQCFEGLEIEGDPICLDRVRGGHCTHSCEADEDCCAVEGECDTGLEQVCSPFESAEGMMCFLTCEAEDVDGSDYADESEYCQRLVSPDFSCRSSGGGSNNRKICVPGDCGVGASCASTDECANGLDCVTGVRGGYCGLEGCASSADCPSDSACVRAGGVSFCARACAADSDCSACRFEGEMACRDDVTFVGDDGSGARCVPR